MKVNNLESLRQEKLRLKGLALDYEQNLHYQLSQMELQLGPIARFFFSSKKKEDNLKPGQDWLNKGLHTAIPLLVDRLTLGPKGFLLNRGLTIILQFFTGKITSEKLNQWTNQLIQKGLSKISSGKKWF